MSYQIKTPVFEGPLDLLLQLITSHQLEITELSLTAIVGEYIKTLEMMREFDIDVTSEFLLIAATLIQLKARHLLPDDREIDLDEELALAEERDRLLSRLLACLTFKDVAAVIRHRIEASTRFVPRLAGLDEDIRPAPPTLTLTTSPAQLAAIAEAVFSRGPASPDLDHLALDMPSVDDAIADLRRRVSAVARADFDALVAHCERPIEVVAYFLALLELARWGVLTVEQDAKDAPILVTHASDETPYASSEWAR